MNAVTKYDDFVDLLWNGMLAISAVTVFAMLPLEALAGTPAPGQGSGSALDQLFCNILGVFTGPVGKGIATIAIVIVGVGALMGKVTWTVAIIVAMGVAIIFGASSIVTSFSGQGAAEDLGNDNACDFGDTIDTTYN